MKRRTELRTFLFVLSLKRQAQAAESFKQRSRLFPECGDGRKMRSAAGSRKYGRKPLRAPDHVCKGVHRYWI